MLSDMPRLKHKLAGYLAKVQVLFTHVVFPTGRRLGYVIGQAKAKTQIKKVKKEGVIFLDRDCVFDDLPVK